MALTTLQKVLAITAAVIAVLLIGMGFLGLFNIFNFDVIRILGGLSTIVLGSALGYWSYQTLNEVEKPFALDTLKSTTDSSREWLAKQVAPK